MKVPALACLLLAAAQPAITFEQLATQTFAFEDGVRVQFRNLSWKDPKTGDVFQLFRRHAIGDLNGDKSPDAVGVVWRTSPRAKPSSYLFVFINRGGGNLQQLEAPTHVGEDTEVITTFIEDGVLTIRFAKPDLDGPERSLRVEQRYRVIDGKLELEI